MRYGCIAEYFTHESPPLKTGEVLRIPLTAWFSFSSKIMLHKQWRWFSMKTPKHLYGLRSTYGKWKYRSKEWNTGCKDKNLSSREQQAKYFVIMEMQTWTTSRRRGKKKKRWKRLRANEQTRLTALLSGKTRGGRRQNWWTVTVWQIRPLLDVLILNREWLMDLLHSSFIYRQ